MSQKNHHYYCFIANIREDHKMNLTEQTQPHHHSKNYKSFSKVFSLLLNLYLSSFYIGYCITYLGPFSIDVQKIFNINNEFFLTYLFQIQTLILQIGGGVGALLSYILFKKFSRRNSLIAVHCLSLMVGGLFFIQHQLAYIICSTLQAICIGVYSVLIPIMIREFAPTEIYGTLGGIFQSFLFFGVFISSLLLTIVENNFLYWRILFGFPLVLKTVETLLLFFMYKFQTPAYLISKNQDSECKNVLTKLYKQEYVNIIYQEKRRQAYPISEPLLYQSQILQMTHKIKFRKRRIFISIHITLLQQFNLSNYKNSQLYFYLSRNLLIVGSVLLILSLFAILLFSRVQRRTILQTGTICLIQFISMMIILYNFSLRQNETLFQIVLLFSVILLLLVIGLTLGPFFWVYIPEIVPPEVIPFSTCAYWGIPAIIFCLKILMGGYLYVIYFQLIWYFLSLFLNFQYVLETKGKTQEQIYIAYDKKNL